MDKLLDLSEKVIAIASVGICVVAGAMRLTGIYHVAGIETITLFIVGIGGMLGAVLLKLHLKA